MVQKHLIKLTTGYYFLKRTAFHYIAHIYYQIIKNLYFQKIELDIIFLENNLNYHIDVVEHNVQEIQSI